MDNKLVRYSRAGDAFHYRWAARRCLRLIDPHSSLKCVTVEASKESDALGEYIIDLAEYSEIEGRKSIAYFQLKHTSTRVRKPFTRSEMAATLKGFAKRFAALRKKGNHSTKQITFSFVTNRPINEATKHAARAIANGSKADRQHQKFLERTTGLRNRHLQAFCASLLLIDGEGDYSVQKQRLKSHLSEYIAGFVHSQEVDAIIAMVADRALPKSEDGRQNGEIYREDVLKRLGVTSERDLFPAPAEFEKFSHAIQREQHVELLQKIIAASGPIIVHAEGGVGKSVVARQLADSFPKGSQGFVYDCFGGGKYRNTSEPRHRACDALIQLSNEMAARGLCRPLISHAGIPTDAIFRAFLERMKQAAECLREVEPNALLVMLVDAADNAEVAAVESADRCFAHELLLEEMPTGCRLVILCRTERIGLLKAGAESKPFELRPFSENETATHLRQVYATASDQDCLEFHRLTGGNPRVQANALASAGSISVEDVLQQIGPGQTTVADQIISQLDAAISEIKERHINERQIDAICRGLANLPPFIPLEVLARAAAVDVSAVKSFISDLGRPLWHTDDAVQFRDEPTETWFRERFSASKEQVVSYLTALEPLAKQYTYVAKVLPQLLLKSENFDRLVSLALSDEFLPENNAIDQRDIRLFRLQFAFKAALKLRRWADTIRLALRAGEEAAGNDRQLSLLKANLHLIAPLQGPHRVQELAFRRAFASGWDGSENVFSASLFSSINDFHGESRTYLRAARKWLQIHFEEREKRAKSEKDRPALNQDELQTEDIAELGWAYLNLNGASEVVQFLLNWRPAEFIFRMSRLLISRLVDAGRFAEINQIAHLGEGNIYLMLAVADELLSVAHFPPKRSLRRSLDLLAERATRIPKPQSFAPQDNITPALLSLLEASASYDLPHKKILAVLNFYVAATPDQIVGSNIQKESRRIFLRGAGLRAMLEGRKEVVPNSLLPERKGKKPHKGGGGLTENEEREIIEWIGPQLPWYVLRARLLDTQASVGQEEIEQVKKLSEKELQGRYRVTDRVPWEISRVRFESLALNKAANSDMVDDFRKYLGTSKQLSLTDRLEATRAAFRLDHLSALREPLEKSCRDTIEAPGTEGPDEHASWLISLARAVLPISSSDAAAYFNQAVEAVSKFGDEMVERWVALVAVARKVGRSKPEVAYRFIRCAEMIGDTVAREKYWDRDDVFRVAVHLDGPSAFAALSRWRDRSVGSFDDQLLALATEAVDAGILPSDVAWCLSSFEGCNASGSYARICLQRELRPFAQQRLLDAAARDFELAGRSLRHLMDLKAAADTVHLSSAKLNGLIEAHAAAEASGSASLNNSFSIDNVPPAHSTDYLDETLAGIDLFGLDGLEVALERFRQKGHPLHYEKFWGAVIFRIPAGREADFLNSLVSAGQLSIYEMDDALTAVKAAWLGKAGVRREWSSFLQQVGKRHAVALSRHGSLRYFQEKPHLSETELTALRSGIVEGLAEFTEMMGPHTFFGFVELVAGRLNANEASDLLDYALSRFEAHIDESHGDGLWAEWLRPSGDASEAVVGMIWSALGSPHSSTRWEAAHCVRRLVANSCDREIAALIRNMEAGGVGPYGSHRFPFYDLHAKLYLLISLVRAAADEPGALRPHAGIFAQMALEGMPHVLIQKTSAQIALSIQRKFGRTYTAAVVKKLRRVGTSSLPVKTIDGQREQVEINWSGVDGGDLSLDFYFGYDFDRYWLKPLGRVFGIPEAKIVKLAHDVAVQNLRIPSSKTDLKDPRKDQWNALARYEGGPNTWHDHGGYPRVDDYTFYYAYHACLSTAAQLLSRVQVVRDSRYDYDENRWEEWLVPHSLARTDGKWLADRRDPTPIQRRAWVNTQEREHWEWGINADDFIEMLRRSGPLPNSLCVSGHWAECDNSHEEMVHLASALVNPADAISVATSLRTSDEIYWSALPRLGDDESASSHTALKGWINKSQYLDRRLDSFDPYAREIRYPPREIAQNYLALLRLRPDSERRKWHLPNAREPSVVSEVWSDKCADERDKPYRFGERIHASLDVLKTLCVKTRMDLIFEVLIERRLDRRYSAARTDRMDPVPPSRKIFILSADGILREKQKQFRLD